MVLILNDSAKGDNIQETEQLPNGLHNLCDIMYSWRSHAQLQLFIAELWLLLQNTPFMKQRVRWRLCEGATMHVSYMDFAHYATFIDFEVALKIPAFNVLSENWIENSTDFDTDFERRQHTTNCSVVPNGHHNGIVASAKAVEHMGTIVFMNQSDLIHSLNKCPTQK